MGDGARMDREETNNMFQVDVAALDPLGGFLATARGRWIGFAVLILLTFVVYIPAIQAGFIWDDDRYLTQNVHVQSAEGFWKIWIPGVTDQWYPLVFLSFWIEHQLWGLDAAGYHVVNIMLHVVNAILIWRLGLRLRLPLPWLIAVLFAVHPVAVESVAWITERKNTLSAVFYLSAFLTYLRFDESRRARFYVLTVLLFVAALLSKSVTATLPVAIILAIIWLRRTIQLRHVLTLLPLFALGIGFGLHTAHLESSHVGASGEFFDFTLMDRVLIACRAMWFYVVKIIYPWPIIFIYPRWEIDASAPLQYLPVIGGIAVLAWGGWRAARGKPGLLLLTLFCAATLFPALGFFNVYPFLMSFVADHFNYLGIPGCLTIVVCCGLWLLTRTLQPRAVRRVIATSAIVVVGVFSVLTFRQCYWYEDQTTLWTRTLEANPEAWIAMVNLAGEYRKQGDVEKAEPLLRDATGYAVVRHDAHKWLAEIELERRNIPAAMEHIDQALEARPDSAVSHYNFGTMLWEVGERRDALRLLERAVALDPDAPAPAATFGQYLASFGRFEEAVPFLQRAVDLEPTFARHMVFAQILRRLDQHSKAADQLKQALLLQSESTAEDWLIESLARSGRSAEAASTARSLAQRSQGDARFALPLAWILATANDPAVRNASDAQRIVADQHARFGPTARSMQVYAAVLAELGQFDAAVQAAEDTIAAANEAGLTAMVNALQRQLIEYRRGRPCRDPWPIP